VPTLRNGKICYIEMPTVDASLSAEFFKKVFGWNIRKRATKAMVDGIQGLRPDGRLVTMGADAEPLPVSLMDLIAKRIRIIGSQQNGPEYLYEALDFVAQGKVKTIVETYPLAEAPKAYEHSTASMTLDSYTHSLGEDHRRIAAQLGGILFPLVPNSGSGAGSPS
jgi:Zinc-binding dehydrogenase